jgi:hypothetical protein
MVDWSDGAYDPGEGGLEPGWLKRALEKARMSWANRAIADLMSGDETVVIPHGNSMKGLIESGEHVELRPPKDEDLKPGAIVLVRCKGNVYLHLIKAVQGKRYLIGNNRGGTNGWVGRTAIYGVKK